MIIFTSHNRELLNPFGRESIERAVMSVPIPDG